jgi:hypothetical protein
MAERERGSLTKPTKIKMDSRFPGNDEPEERPARPQVEWKLRLSIKERIEDAGFRLPQG